MELAENFLTVIPEILDQNEGYEDLFV